MYTLLVYDVASKRTGKCLKICRRYLNWIQNSVFEGEISDSRLAALKAELGAVLQDSDSVIMFHSREARWLKREIMGEARADINNFL